MLSFGKRIQYYRKQNHLTQEQLAEKLMVSRQAVSKWESDVNEPDIKTLVTLSQIFNITIDELITGRIEEEIEEIDDEMFDEIDQEILKTNKKNHTLLLFLTGFVVCLICIFLICPIMSSIGQNSNEPIIVNERNITTQLEKDRYLVNYLYIEAKITSYTKQLMELKGNVGFTLINNKQDDMILKVIYKDKTEEELSIYLDGEGNYSFDKEIAAKDIDKLNVQVGKQKREINNISFPIEEYMYGVTIQPEYKDVTKDQYNIKFDVYRCSNNEEMYNKFEDCMNINDEVEQDLSTVKDIQVVVKKDGKELKTIHYHDLDELSKYITISEPYMNNSQYEYEISYLTPLNQTITYKYTGENNEI